MRLGQQEAQPTPNLFLLDVKSCLFSYARKFIFQRINTSRKCITYIHICPHFLEGKLPNYLCASVNDRSIIHIVQFKARNHYLRIETGSWARPRIVPEERVCPVCMVVEDELTTHCNLRVTHCINLSFVFYTP